MCDVFLWDVWMWDVRDVCHDCVLLICIAGVFERRRVLGPTERGASLSL